MQYKIVVIAVIISFFLISCARENNNGNGDPNPVAAQDSGRIMPRVADIVEIRERMFVTQINEIYMNAGDYLGRAIKLEGIFKILHNEGDAVFLVIRYAPDGCCGTRGFSGFEVKADANLARHFPADDSWVEATGVLKEYGIGFNKFLYLELFSLKALNTRGEEFVTR